MIYLIYVFLGNDAIFTNRCVLSPLSTNVLRVPMLEKSFDISPAFSAVANGMSSATSQKFDSIKGE